MSKELSNKFAVCLKSIALRRTRRAVTTRFFRGSFLSWASSC